MSGFCESQIDSNRIRIWLMTPHDAAIIDPCERCCRVLRSVLGVTTADPPTLQALTAALDEAGRRMPDAKR